MRYIIRVLVLVVVIVTVCAWERPKVREFMRITLIVAVDCAGSANMASSIVIVVRIVKCALDRR